MNINDVIRTYLYRSLAMLALIVAVSGFDTKRPEIFTNHTDDVKHAISGYDPVAYFKKADPTKGKKQFNYRWKEADWYFETATNRDLFIANPEKYAPQYGGYCAFAVSRRGIAPTDPTKWVIYKDKLYLNFNYEAHQLWLGKMLNNIKKADENWPTVLNK